MGHYTWIFTSRIFRLASEITFLLFFLQMITSYSHKVENVTNVFAKWPYLYEAFETSLFCSQKTDSANNGLPGWLIFDGGHLQQM